MTIVGHGPRNGFKVAARSTADIRLHAMRLRQLFGITGPRFNAERTLEDLTKYGVTVDVVDDNDPELPRGVEACWVPDTVTLTIRLSVYKAACRGEPRALFTIAHELGHLALAHRRAFHRDASGTCRMFEDSEWQANTFAAEFLMPLDQIKHQRVASAVHIELMFGVSAQAAETRFNKLRGKGEI
ncbi:ImmA/IrrE family metallo-endopeptidase [Caldimonas thermodepolymerans]|uniref:IrrE N-terminal-like domain-containing protein n=1 Tax=Caldimonas thermodepolymerans TaxID=215580 RepID=A0A2S5T8I8_9BURK|nr:ImmA/IrrE family metallo-endopeptidase [Caldimonas thermodepolymerans]PPE71188.1 hypothetical protein C1702_01835 [Caldimonas thermodepolymerans]QPC32360.1 ImmA/IrrE family metallo-endopeptidase [Caldimonas thermodepolymerans]RDH98741.1 uncharacterized protein DUF955 [Caldimonas thermodepolymerans]